MIHNFFPLFRQNTNIYSPISYLRQSSGKLEAFRYQKRQELLKKIAMTKKFIASTAKRSELAREPPETVWEKVTTPYLENRAFQKYGSQMKKCLFSPPKPISVMNRHDHDALPTLKTRQISILEKNIIRHKILKIYLKFECQKMKMHDRYVSEIQCIQRGYVFYVFLRYLRMKL